MRPQDSRDGADADPLERRVQEMDLGSVQDLLAALDRDEARLQAPETQPVLDTSAARAALEALRKRDGLEAAIRERAEALEAVSRELELRLAAKGQAPVLAQGLRRLEETLYLPPAFAAADVGSAASLLADFDEAFAAVQQQAREALETCLGLRRFEPPEGDRIEPLKHRVTGSRSGGEPHRDNTVAESEAPGWMLGDEILAQADVVRYSWDGGGRPGLPDPDTLAPGSLDAARIGRKA